MGVFDDVGTVRQEAGSRTVTVDLPSLMASPQAILRPATMAPPDRLRVTDERLSAVTTLIALARQDPGIRAALKAITAEGYLVAGAGDGEGVLVRRGCVGSFWDEVRTGECSLTRSGVAYSYHEPEWGAPARYLVVVFSGMHSDWNHPGLDRYIFPQFRHIGSLTPPGTAVLRLGDLGGISGSFFMDTADAPSNCDDISELIVAAIRRLGLPPQRVCLIGPSKGATGAATHGLRLHLPFIAVDPIVDDTFYREERDDQHFTGAPIFPRRVEEVLAELIDEPGSASPPPGVVLTARGSEISSDALAFARDLRRPCAVHESDDPRVGAHPDVARAVLGPAIAALNALLLGIPVGSTIAAQSTSARQS